MAAAWAALAGLRRSLTARLLPAAAAVAEIGPIQQAVAAVEALAALVLHRQVRANRLAEPAAMAAPHLAGRQAEVAEAEAEGEAANGLAATCLVVSADVEQMPLAALAGAAAAAVAQRRERLEAAASVAPVGPAAMAETAPRMAAILAGPAARLF
jgi:hypothetical protein